MKTLLTNVDFTDSAKFIIAFIKLDKTSKNITKNIAMLISIKIKEPLDNQDINNMLDKKAEDLVIEVFNNNPKSISVCEDTIKEIFFRELNKVVYGTSHPVMHESLVKLV